VDEITFAELMTHRSGLRQSYELATGKGGKVTGAYENIGLAVSQDVGDTSTLPCPPTA
jgi:CubicO group peptidase (beta-lactamase class C family)